MRKRYLSAISAQVLTAGAMLFCSVFTVAAQQETGHDYVVKPGDGLYKLGRKFYNNGAAYKTIIKAHNEKALTDSRYQTINPDQGLAVGQLIWIPLAEKNQDNNPIVTKKPKVTDESLDEKNLAADYSLPEPKLAPATKAVQIADNGTKTRANPDNKDDPAYIVTMPKTNCEIQIWYNFQLVAIKAINQRWKEMGVGLVERAKRAHQMRHEARLNGRYMMQDRFEVAALRDRDNKKYGNPDGPTFEHMVAYGRENGLSGDRVYEGIIESSGHVQPVYKSSCKKS